MAKEKKVQQITDMEVDFAQWYTDICRKAARREKKAPDFG